MTIMTLQDYLDRMLQDLQLRGMAPSTQKDYVRAVQKVAEHYNKLPDQITEEELREYFLYLKMLKSFPATHQQLPCAASNFLHLHNQKRLAPGKNETIE